MLAFLLTTLVFASPFVTLEPGLDLAVLQSPRASIAGDSRISVLRIDAGHFEFEVLTQLQSGGPSRTVRDWADDGGLVAAINAAMFHPDLSSTELLISRGEANNPHLGSSNTILAFHPTDPSSPAVRLIDRQCDDLDTLRVQYSSFVQSIRLRSCDGRNVWTQQPRIWSHAVVGTDSSGRVLFIHARSPWSTHDFIEILVDLPLELDRLQYAEGGPEASLFVRSGQQEHLWVGSYETGFNENDDNHHPWPIPNVIGIRRHGVAKMPTKKQLLE